ncbi:MAG: hypothetical protein GX442_01240 [Candidatus Riflebacteria bacterium]|nr:hypothetical protein [Candidatus Riflebacteria bacterium]
MSRAQELSFLVQQRPELQPKEIEQSLECRLTGAGFESWEGIVAATPRQLLLASSPGVFSRGLAVALGWAEIRSVTATADEIRVGFGPAGGDRAIVLAPSASTLEADWVALALAALLRQSGAVRVGVPFPTLTVREGAAGQGPGAAAPETPFLAPLPEGGAGLADAVGTLAALFPRQVRLGLWQAALLLAGERPGKAREVLEGLEGVAGDDLPGWSLLMAMAAFLTGKCRLARAILVHWQASSPPGARGECSGNPSGARVLGRLGILVHALLEGLPGEPAGAFAAGPHPVVPPGLPFPVLRGYQAHRLFQIDSFRELYKILWGPAGWLLEAWDALGRGRDAEAADFLERYRKGPAPDALDLLRLEAALRHQQGDLPLAWAMLLASGAADFELPLLALAVSLGRTDLPYPPPGPERLPMLAPELLLAWVGYLLAAGRAPDAASLLAASAGRREALSAGLKAGFLVLEAEAALATGHPGAAAEAVRPLLAQAGLVVAGAEDPGPLDPTGDLLLHPAFPDLLVRACVVGAETRLAAGDGATALWWLGFARQGVERLPGAGRSRWEALDHLARQMMGADGPLEVRGTAGPGRPPGPPGGGAGLGTVGPLPTPETGVSRRHQGWPSGPSDPVSVGPDPSSPPTGWAALAGLLDRHRRTFGDRPPPGLDPALPEELEVIGRSLGRPPLVAVVGEFNAGKSTFLNALLETPVLPVGVTPTTRLPCVVRWGPAPLALALDAVGGRTAHPLAEVADLLDQRRALLESRELVLIEVYAPLPMLRDLWFVDMPGLNSRFAHHQRYAESFLREADLVIWVSSATQLGQASERQALTRLVRPFQPVLAVLNRLDEIDEAERAGVIEAHQALMAGQAMGTVAVAARPAAADPALRRTWDGWFEPWRAGTAVRHREAVHRRARDLARRTDESVRAFRDRFAGLAGPLPGLAELLAGPVGEVLPGEFEEREAWRALGRRIRGLLEVPPPRSVPLRAQIEAQLQDLEEAMVGTFLRLLVREAEGLLFPCLERWRLLTTLPPFHPGGSWVTALQARTRARLAGARALLSRTFWEASQELTTLGTNGLDPDPVLPLTAALEQAARRWLGEFRQGLWQANRWFTQWSHSLMAAVEHASLTPFLEAVRETGAALQVPDEQPGAGKPDAPS